MCGHAQVELSSLALELACGEKLMPTRCLPLSKAGSSRDREAYHVCFWDGDRYIV